MTKPLLPDDAEMDELLECLKSGAATAEDKERFMRGAVYRGAIGKGRSEVEAVMLATSEHVAQLALAVKVE